MTNLKDLLFKKQTKIIDILAELPVPIKLTLNIDNDVYTYTCDEKTIIKTEISAHIVKEIENDVSIYFYNYNSLNEINIDVEKLLNKLENVITKLYLFSKAQRIEAGKEIIPNLFKVEYVINESANYSDELLKYCRDNKLIIRLTLTKHYVDLTDLETKIVDHDYENYKVVDFNGFIDVKDTVLTLDLKPNQY